MLLLAAATLSASAQNKKPPVVYKQAVSFSPLALADMDHTLLLTGEYRLKPNLALLTDVGYIFASDYISSIKSTWGLNIRPALRVYHGKRNKGYLQVQGFYKMVNYTLYDWLGKDCVNGVPSYEKLQDFTYRKNVYGFHFTAGGVLPLSPSNRWLIDLYGGLGVRYKTHKLVNEEEGCYNLGPEALFDFHRDDVTTLSIPMGVRITHVLR